MSCILIATVLAAVLAAVALAGLSALPAQADRACRNRLDEKGTRFGASWVETGRFDTLIAAGMDDVRLVVRWMWTEAGRQPPLAVAKAPPSSDGSEPAEKFIAG